ncbi:MAG TPA: tol-pal system-associated acyl-CoA thioesterase [Alphaproteobacteria bacterium]|nr:tol-pal system-associated acyl-CoA thioesterase [Alphaproteobacteria bacterium]
MAPSASPLATGTHVFPVRVYYEDTDAGGIVYHASYLRFAERARTEMMRLIGIESSKLSARAGVSFAVSRCAIDYFKPARLDDLLEVHTKVIEVKRASLDAEQTVKRADVDLARLVLRLAVVNQGGRAVRLPAEIRNALINLSQSESHS